MNDQGITRRDLLQKAGALSLLALAPQFLGACTLGDFSQAMLDAETAENIASVLWMDKYDPAKIPPDLAGLLRSKTNSPKAFGARMTAHLDEMLANPENFTPDYTERYNAFKAYAAQLSPHQAYAMTAMLGLDSSRGYQELPSAITFSFPEDDRPWFDIQCGWHFYVGSAFTASGDEYGIQLMFWQVALLPDRMAKEAGLTTIENQMAEIHFAVSRAGDRHYRAKPIVVAGTTGLISFASDPYDYVIGKNFMRSRQPGSLFPLQLRAWGKDNIQADPVEIEIDLTLNQTKGYILNGDAGLAPSCGGIGTLYYSVPNLQLDPANSVLRMNGQEIRLTSGKFWYDHQWGPGFIPAGNPRSEVLRAANRLADADPVGWDWLPVQFDDNTELGLSALHTHENAQFYHNTAPEAPGTMTTACSGSYVDEAGTYVPVTGTIQVTDWIRSTISHGQYVATNTWYPNRVEVTMDTPVIPESRRVFSMVPIVDTGQLGFFAHGSEYSEGAVYIEDRNGTRIGRGFLESPGYADEANQILLLAGMPQTAEMRALIAPPTFTPELKASAAVFLAKPENQALFLEEYGKCRGL